MRISDDEACLLQELADATKMDTWFYLRYNESTGEYYIEDLEEDIVMTIDEALHIMFDGVDLSDIKHLGFNDRQITLLKRIEQRLKGENKYMTYLETLKEFNKTGLEIVDIKVAIEVEHFFGTDNIELFEALCSEVKWTYLKFEWATIKDVTSLLKDYLDNYPDDRKISALKEFNIYFKNHEEELY